MIYLEAPELFSPKFDVVSCFVEHDGNILLLHRQDHKPQGNTWGVPAGKVDAGESPVFTMARELLEETGISSDQNELLLCDKVYVRYPDYDFIYYIYRLVLSHRPMVNINEGEHKDYKWLSPEEALNVDLIPDEDFCIKKTYKIND